MSIPPPPTGAAGIPAGDRDFCRAPMPDRGQPPEPTIDIDVPELSEARSKEKQKESKNDDVECAFEGYSLEKAAPSPGRQASWSRVGKRQLPFDSKKLEALVKEHRQKTRTGPPQDFQQLGRRQQGVINQLIDARKQADKNKTADWVLVDVQQYQIRHFSTPNETVRIQIVLKRQSKEKTKPNDSKSVSATGGYQEAGIIDLSNPPAKKGKKEKKDELEDLVDMLDPTDFGHPEGGGTHGHGQHHSQDPSPGPPPPPDTDRPADPIAIPTDLWLPSTAPSHRHPQQAFPMNPFQPDPRFVNADQFALPMQAPPEAPRARMMTRPVTPQQRRLRSARRLGELEGEIEVLKDDLRESRDEVEQVRRKIDRWKLSSNGSNESDSLFSPSADYSTPPSSLSSHSPGREFYRGRKPEPRQSRSRSRDWHRRGERERRDREERESYDRDRRYERDRRHRDERSEIRPAYSYVSGLDRRGGRYSPERETPRAVPPAPRLPPLVRTQTLFDEYPAGRIAGPAALPSPRVPRRLVDHSRSFEPAGPTGERSGRQQAEAQRRVVDFDNQYGATRRNGPGPRTGRRRDTFAACEYHL